MKIFISFTLFLFSFIAQAQFNNYDNGDTVADFTVTDVNGETHNLYEYTSQGKYVYMDFFYSVCGGCQNLIPVFNALYDKYGCNEGDLICIAMNSGYDKNQDVIDFESTYGGNAHHAPAISSEGGCLDVVADFDPKYYPAVCLIGPDNTMINADIHPYETVEDLENAFPESFNPSVMECSLGVQTEPLKPSFEIYPNPTDGKEIFIKNNQDRKIENIRIVNILGQILFESRKEIHSRLPVNLKAGTYNMIVQTRTDTVSLKFIVK